MAESKAWVMIPKRINEEDVIDMHPLVLCKECKYYSEPTDEERGQCLIKQGYFAVDGDWFCADGERNEQSFDNLLKSQDYSKDFR